jgi:hypothetical protein
MVLVSLVLLKTENIKNVPSFLKLLENMGIGRNGVRFFSSFKN